jgi:glycosyltransferase involved in cell wall biosynthesis
MRDDGREVEGFPRRRAGRDRSDRTHDEQVAVSAVLVVPLAPAPGGNGLAMRAALLLDALAADGPVDLVIVPVSGSAESGEWLASRARRIVVVPPVHPTTRAEVVAALGDPTRRAELRALEALPARARLAPPSSAARAASQLADAPRTVVVLRAYLAPFGTALAEHLGAERLVVDADDDDEGLLRARGDDTEADAHGVLAREWLARADRVLAASPIDAAAMGARYGFAVETLPNAVARPPATGTPPGKARLLYVGNLTYAPNVDAVRDLVTVVLPRVRAEVPGATVDLVGAHDERLPGLADHDGVRLAGAVADLAPWYADADVVVVPLREGAGTRVKVLEAFAFHRPVVATVAAVAGLDVVDGVSVHVGDSPAALADHTVRLLRDPARARRTVDEAEAVLAEHYLLDVVVPRARRLLTGDEG